MQTFLRNYSLFIDLFHSGSSFEDWIQSEGVIGAEGHIVSPLVLGLKGKAFPSRV